MLAWAESFDWMTGTVGDDVPDDMGVKYTLSGSGHEIGEGRDFGRSFRSPSSTANSIIITRSLPMISTVVTGFAFRTDGNVSTTDSLMIFRDSVNDAFHVLLRILGDDPYDLALFGGEPLTTLGTATGLNANQWYFVEIKITFSDSGSFELKIDGVSKFSGSHDTTRTAGDYTDEIRIAHGDFRQCEFDDWYVLNGGDFLGDSSVRLIQPTSDASPNLWTPNSGSDHFAAVDETPYDADTTYLEGDAYLARDIFGYDNIAGGSTVHGIQVDNMVRVTDDSSFQLRNIVNNDANVVGDISSQSYVHGKTIYENNPETGQPWTISEVNDAEIGLEIGT